MPQIDRAQDEMQPVNLRGRNGITHAMRKVTFACGERDEPPHYTAATLDPVDCMTCLARGLKSDTQTAYVPLRKGIRT